MGAQSKILDTYETCSDLQCPYSNLSPHCADTTTIVEEVSESVIKVDSEAPGSANPSTTWRSP